MKKLYTIAVVLLSLFLLPSCKKDYNCTCNTETRGQNHAYAQGTMVITYSNVTKSQARSQCSKAAASYNASTLTSYLSDCSL